MSRGGIAAAPEGDAGAAHGPGGAAIETRFLRRLGRSGAGMGRAGTLALGAVLGPQSAAWAQTPAGQGSGEPAAAAHSPSIMNVEPGLMIWTVVTFLVLLVVLRFTAWKPLLAWLDAREKRIREAVEGAERARKESEELLAQHRRLLEQAKQDANALFEQGKAEGLKLKDEITAHARAEAEETRARALHEIELATDEAKKELFVHASRLSVELAERILRRSLDDADQRRLLEGAFDDYRSQAKS